MLIVYYTKCYISWNVKDINSEKHFVDNSKKRGKKKGALQSKVLLLENHAELHEYVPWKGSFKKIF